MYTEQFLERFTIYNLLLLIYLLALGRAYIFRFFYDTTIIQFLYNDDIKEKDGTIIERYD